LGRDQSTPIFFGVDVIRRVVLNIEELSKKIIIAHFRLGSPLDEEGVRLQIFGKGAVENSGFRIVSHSDSNLKLLAIKAK
jgi:hypothetical protein